MTAKVMPIAEYSGVTSRIPGHAKIVHHQNADADKDAGCHDGLSGAGSEMEDQKSKTDDKDCNQRGRHGCERIIKERGLKLQPEHGDKMH